MKNKFKTYIVHYDRLIDRKANLEKVLIQQDIVRIHFIIR